MYNDTRMTNWSTRLNLEGVGEGISDGSRLARPATSPQSDLTGIGESFSTARVGQAQCSISSSYTEPALHIPTNGVSQIYSISHESQRSNDIYLHPNDWMQPECFDNSNLQRNRASYGEAGSSTAASYIDDGATMDGGMVAQNTPLSGSGPSQPKKNNVELPDWFWAHDPESYEGYQRACSFAYSDFNEFKRNSLMMHKRRGNITREHISEEQFKAALEARPQGRFLTLAEKYTEQWKLVRHELFGTDISAPIRECNNPHKPHKPRRSVREKKVQARNPEEKQSATLLTESAPEITRTLGHDPRFPNNIWTPQPDVSPDQPLSICNPTNASPHRPDDSKFLSFHNPTNMSVTTMQERFKAAWAQVSRLELTLLGRVQRDDLRSRLDTALQRFTNEINDISKQLSRSLAPSILFPQQPQQPQPQPQPSWHIGHVENTRLYLQDNSSTADLFAVDPITGVAANDGGFPPGQPRQSHILDQNRSGRRTY